MTITQQALHIFSKDVRRLRWEIGALILIAVFLVWLWTDSWSGETNGAVIRLRSRELTAPYLAAIWFLMIARLIHAEPLVGDRHFWLTRPYSRSAVLLAKGLFAAAFLLLPLLIAQVLAVSLSGLPLSLGALLVNQLAIAAVVCLPAAAVATLTQNMWQHVPLVIIGGLAVFRIAQLQTGGGSIGPVGPVPYVVGVTLLGAVSLALLLAQYHGRRTGRNAAAYFVACAAVWLLVVAFPRDFAWTMESVLDEASPDGPVSFGIGPPSALADLNPRAFERARRLAASDLLRLPIDVGGVDLSGVVATDFPYAIPTVTLRTPAGVTFPVDAAILQNGSGLALLLDRDLSRDTPLMNEAVSIHAELWLKQFERVATAELPADGSAVILGNREQCRAIRPGSPDGTAPLRPRTVVMCRHALSAAPWREYDVRGAFRGWNIRTFLGVVPTIDPIEETSPVTRELGGAPPATVELRERVAFFRATIDANNLRLADYLEE